MEVLRLPPYPIDTKWDVPSPNTQYQLYVEDLVDHSVELTTVTSDANSQVTYTITQAKAQFDRIFLFRILSMSGGIIVDSNLDILRPYIDYRTLGTTASEIQEYKILEMVARSLIDSITPDGFYNNKHIIETNGSGSDYFPVLEDVNKVLKVYRDNQLIYDADAEDPTTNEATYTITLDNSAIIRDEEGEYDRVQSAPLRLPVASGDLGIVGGSGGVAFPMHCDFLFVLDVGYKAVPPDIEYATKLLIDDLKCGRLDYYKRFITNYSTDQYRIQFDKSVFNGTGNLIVDKIIDNYVTDIHKFGVL